MFYTVVLDKEIALNPEDVACLLYWDSNDDLISFLEHVIEDESINHRHEVPVELLRSLQNLVDKYAYDPPPKE